MLGVLVEILCLDSVAVHRRFSGECKVALIIPMCVPGRTVLPRAVTVYRDTLTEGFSHFVTSIAAPGASGWSGCRVGLAPTGEHRLVTAHTRSSQFKGVN